ncbi:hypothetical protein [Prosthecomicrobium sp. N25]|uniref:hypothetical protein n=1 Tax=Prosthecomicrobium sp. N25 TaxID=3129254 RepID=UPI003076FE6D
MNPDLFAGRFDAAPRSAPDEPRTALASDLFFSLTAVIAPLLALVLPLVGLGAGRAALDVEAAAALLRTARITDGGAEAAVVVAGPRRLAYGHDRTAPVPLDAAPDDPGLRAYLAEAARDGRPVLLAIEPGGEEGGFVAEPLVARAGVGRLLRLRLGPGCRPDGLARGECR